MSEVRDQHQPLCRWLREQGIEFLYHRPDTKSGLESGWPDFSIFAPAGPAPLFIEFKLPKTGVLSAKQKAVHARLIAKGFSVHVIRSLEAAISLVQFWRIPVAMPSAEQSSDDLRIFGQMVVRANGNGWDFVRKASDNDRLRLRGVTS